MKQPWNETRLSALEKNKLVTGRKHSPARKNHYLEGRAHCINIKTVSISEGAEKENRSALIAKWLCEMYLEK